MKRKNKKQTQEEIFLKAFRKANREIELQRNDGKWVSTHRVWKNKKKYDRKRDGKVNPNHLSFLYFIFTKINHHLSSQLPR